MDARCIIYEYADELHIPQHHERTVRHRQHHQRPAVLRRSERQFQPAPHVASDFGRDTRMKIIILADDDIIAGVPRSRGEVVAVADSYGDNIRRVIAEHVEQRDRQAVEAKIEKVKGRKREEIFREALAKLIAILQADYSQFWAALQKRPAVQDAIIQEMRENPDILRRAIEDPQWFVDEVTKRFKPNGGQGNNRNAK